MEIYTYIWLDTNKIQNCYVGQWSLRRANFRFECKVEHYAWASQLRLEGGTRCEGSSEGRSWPSVFTLMRCMASANSSSSRNPSLSMSDNFQILPRTEFGSFDFTISVLAAVEKIYYQVVWSWTRCRVFFIAKVYLH